MGYIMYLCCKIIYNAGVMISYVINEYQFKSLIRRKTPNNIPADVIGLTCMLYGLQTERERTRKGTSLCGSPQIIKGSEKPSLTTD